MWPVGSQPAARADLLVSVLKDSLLELTLLTVQIWDKVSCDNIAWSVIITQMQSTKHKCLVRVTSVVACSKDTAGVSDGGTPEAPGRHEILYNCLIRDVSGHLSIRAIIWASTVAEIKLLHGSLISTLSFEPLQLLD